MARRYDLLREDEYEYDEQQAALAYTTGRERGLRDFARSVFGATAPSADLAGALARLTARLHLCEAPAARAALGRLVRCLLALDSPLVSLCEPELPGGQRSLTAVARLAELHAQWLREPEDWYDTAREAGPALAGLARHLLAWYPVPECCDSLLAEERRDTRVEWWLHLAAGGPLRTAPGLPVPLTARMAHLALQSPPEAGFIGALRRGQVLAPGGTEALAHEVALAWLGRTLLPPAEEAWWQAALQWLAARPRMPLAEVGPLLDYLRHLRRREPGFALEGRAVPPLLRGMGAWHRDLAAAAAARAQARGRLAPCGLQPGSYTGADGRKWLLVELTSVADLSAEGAAQNHCAGRYAGAVRSGHSSVWSLRRLEGERVRRAVTVEVCLYSRAVVQIRGRGNRPAADWEKGLVGRWAWENRLTMRV